ncbi:hypothetical protein [Cellulomonas fimi]|uniref:DNA methylase adenine-specific domain-containing protein n=1 Tax=Cellulomonas fimi TaxID=1708 RepID=A0A7Y0LZU4_CELFI|nr:hypothetical protein [Cellulomonas fimi]NMR20458.1 hypothetical protein [Cellulomonas fimi]
MQKTPTRRLLSLPDVAALARVQRPVASMWRSRSAGTSLPFPEPASRADGQDLFDADDVTSWLVATGRGNNPAVREESALFTFVDGLTDLDSAVAFDGLTALLALRAAAGVQLSGRGRIEVLDLADAVDPQDRWLYRELDALGEDLTSLADHADDVADAAYTVPAAFESLKAHRFRRGIREYTDTTFSPAVLELAARIATELIDPDQRSSATVVDPSGGSDLLVTLGARLTDGDGTTAVLPATGTATVRLAGRRLIAHGWGVTEAGADEANRRGPLDSTLLVAQYPSPAFQVDTEDAILDAIDEAVLTMQVEDRAVIIGPARALTNATRTPSITGSRAALLRTDRVRAVVRLPERLWTSRPRQQLALWVLGPAHAGVAIAERWVMVADLSAVRLDDRVLDDLLTDVVAAIGSRETVRSHAFRFGRIMATSALLASSGDLVGSGLPPQHRQRRSAAEMALDVQRLLDVSRGSTTSSEIRLDVAHHEPGPVNVSTLGQLVEAGAARVLPGHRLSPEHVGASGSVRVIGTEEVLGARPLGSRTIDRLTFTAQYPSGRYTEPGDVVFCATPGVGAIVDSDGLSVVLAPARVLRLNRAAHPGLVPDAVARAVRSASARGGWRSWPVRLVPAAQAGALDAALRAVAAARAETERRLAALDELASTLTDGVTTGSLTLNIPRDSDDR